MPFKGAEPAHLLLPSASKIQVRLSITGMSLLRSIHECLRKMLTASATSSSRSRNLSCSTSCCTVCKWQCHIWAGVLAQQSEPCTVSSQSPTFNAGRAPPPAAAVTGNSHLRCSCSSVLPQPRYLKPQHAVPGSCMPACRLQPASRAFLPACAPGAAPVRMGRSWDHANPSQRVHAF